MVSLFKELPSPTVPHNCIPSPLTDNNSSYAHIGAYAAARAHCSVSACSGTFTLDRVRAQCKVQLARARGFALALRA